MCADGVPRNLDGLEEGTADASVCLRTCPEAVSAGTCSGGKRGVRGGGWKCGCGEEGGLVVDVRRRYVIIGRNGVRKSTLLRYIAM